MLPSGWSAVTEANMSALAKVIARDSGLDTRDLSTAMVNRGVWEEIWMSCPLRWLKDNDDDDDDDYTL